MPERTPPTLDQRPPELAVIVPTYNEAEAVAEVARRVASVLEGLDWELIFVDDDSPDGTAERARELARLDPRIRVIQRIGRRGLSSACIEGMLSTTAPYLAVMDGDLQHDEALLPHMLQAIRDEDLDIVVGSRYVAGGDLGDWSARRQGMSRLATWIGRTLIRAELSDPMSGFFIVRASVIHGCVRRLSGVGFKLLLDILSASKTPLRLRELPFRFRPRRTGQSKLDTTVLWEYLLMLIQKLVGPMIPLRFIAFSLIGAFGVLVHLSVLWPILHLLGEDAFLVGQATATLVAMTSNFFLNNLLTYRDLRLRGRQLLWGWLSFVLACSLGALANVGIADYLFRAGHSGWVLSALAGILVGAVWNYAVTAVYTWRRPANPI
ncbi:glycosyltransferase family 2 protein [Thermochromatium tepidum]|uniref:Glycosyltransferase n=1 Tax=Thermochromatium tepidum ATCC 43061 TaxID=316276 RepID=A0A6I6EGP9_THETI|nr:glycosyltransferase family 2 protein [Thermochromatium tepidum]QGU32497.1 glycosyltransferase [Thermochromatium tepidum ATCC 43061]